MSSDSVLQKYTDLSLKKTNSPYGYASFRIL
jgi:hypothetical protein